MARFLKKVDGDYLLKVDGDKIELVFVDYILAVEPASVAITCSDITLTSMVLRVSPTSVVITGSDITLEFLVDRLITDWTVNKDLGPSEWNFTKQPNKVETPHSDGTCGYWWEGKTYDT